MAAGSITVEQVIDPAMIDHIYLQARPRNWRGHSVRVWWEEEPGPREQQRVARGGVPVTRGVTKVLTGLSAWNNDRQDGIFVIWDHVLLAYPILAHVRDLRHPSTNA